jgi:hypothetical protein
MLLYPRLDSRSLPNAPCGQLYLGKGEISDRLNHPVDPLSGDAQHLRDFSHAYEVMSHGRTIAPIVAGRQ